MTHYCLTSRETGAHYIYNPGNPDHGHMSHDGIVWFGPKNDEERTGRQEIMDEIMADVAHGQPEAIRERHQAQIEALMKLKAEVDRKTIGENMLAVLGCAMFAVCLAGCAMIAVACIDIIIKTVGAW